MIDSKAYLWRLQNDFRAWATSYFTFLNLFLRPCLVSISVHAFFNATLHFMTFSSALGPVIFNVIDGCRVRIVAMSRGNFTALHNTDVT